MSAIDQHRELDGSRAAVSGCRIQSRAGSPSGIENVIDEDRIDLLSRSLVQADRAVAGGCNMTDLDVGSLLDNFEWQCGFSKKFGLIRIDHQDQTRHPKKSAKWYRDFIAASRDREK